MTPHSPSGLPLSKQPVVVFVGAFGSGKTEVAINYARAALAAGEVPCLADLDVVTPYFRVGDFRRQLQREGLRIVAPEGKLASYEVPALPPEISGALHARDPHLILDVGGDPEGARLLGVYAPDIQSRGYDMWVVVNPFRLSTASPGAISELSRLIQDASQLRLTGLVANPHLGTMTRSEDVRRGLETVEKSAEALGLPVVFVAAEQSLANELQTERLPLLPLRLTLRLPWESS
ncbi:MAG: hypothetical protein IMF16_03540 [Proteobacteria bacterium]|nr:hypothetical protein [Pseudomonadota bacterium]